MLERDAVQRGADYAQLVEHRAGLTTPPLTAKPKLVYLVPVDHGRQAWIFDETTKRIYGGDPPDDAYLASERAKRIVGRDGKVAEVTAGEMRSIIMAKAVADEPGRDRRSEWWAWFADMASRMEAVERR